MMNKTWIVSQILPHQLSLTIFYKTKFSLKLAPLHFFYKYKHILKILPTSLSKWQFWENLDLHKFIIYYFSCWVIFFYKANAASHIPMMLFNYPLCCWTLEAKEKMSECYVTLSQSNNWLTPKQEFRIFLDWLICV